MPSMADAKPRWAPGDGDEPASPRPPRSFLGRSLPLKPRRHDQQRARARTRARSRTTVNPLLAAASESAATATTSTASVLSARSTSRLESAGDLPVLRHKYVARGVSVLVGSRWRLQPFQERIVELRTGSAPCLLLYPLASDGEREIIGHDTQILPLDTACQLTTGRAGSGSGSSGLKLSSSKENRAFRVRIRFPTAADALIWCRIVQDALRHARWSRHLVPAKRLASTWSSSGSSTSTSVSAVCSTSSSSSGGDSKIAIFVHLATQKQFVVKSLGKNDIDCNEIQIIKRLWTAPSARARELVRGYRVVETESEIRVIMPKLPGESLFQSVRARPSPSVMTEAEACSITHSLCGQLQALRDADIVHCDLKLENIVVKDKTATQVIDFGGAFDLMRVTDIVKSSSSRFSSSTSNNNRVFMVGTPGYIAPERILRPNNPPTQSADVFSLGIVLFQLLAGQHPFTDAIRARRSLKLTDSLTLDWTKAQTLLIMRGVSLEARQLVQRMLEPDPKCRFTVDEILCSPWLAKFSYALSPNA